MRYAQRVRSNRRAGNLVPDMEQYDMDLGVFDTDEHSIEKQYLRPLKPNNNNLQLV